MSHVPLPTPRTVSPRLVGCCRTNCDNTCALAHPSPSPWLIVGWTWMTRESVARRQNDLPRQEPALSSRTRHFDACHRSSCNRRPPRLVIVLSSCVFSALFSSSRSAQRSATCTSIGYCTGISSPPTYFSPSTRRYVRAERTTKGGPKKEKWGRMRFSQETSYYSYWAKSTINSLAESLKGNFVTNLLNGSFFDHKRKKPWV